MTLLPGWPSKTLSVTPGLIAGLVILTGRILQRGWEELQHVECLSWLVWTPLYELQLQL